MVELGLFTMDEEVGAKATPVTRLRRRLSVEPEDSPLSTTPSTPNKKRNTRLAAKPQLDLIDEVAADDVPKRSTRKTAVIDAETNAGTLTPVTPSRRSTRIRSNTSILSETITQSIDSPRAKRALRRTSQHGSDTESTGVVTPARQTRRTRKDSSTSVDQQAATVNVVTTAKSNIVNETIIESEKEFTETSKENENSSLTTRRSPRLNKKGSKAAAKNGDAINDSENTLNTPNQDVHKPTQTVTNTDNLNESNNKIDCASPKAIQNKLTDAMNNALNSTSDKEKVTDELKIKRIKTKSQSSDSEHTKDKSHNSSISGSDDILPNDRNTHSKNVEPDMMSPNKSINKSKSLFLDTFAENKENVDCHSLLTQFEVNKRDTLMVLMEDSDSGCGNHPTSDAQKEGEDQCVPIGKPHESPDKFSQGVEPMDIDESVLANVTLDDFSDKSTDSKDVNDDFEIPDTKRKSVVSEKGIMQEYSTNKSRRKSSFSIPVEVNNDSINKSKTNTSFQEKNSDSKIVQSNKSFSLAGDKTNSNKSRKPSLNADNEQELDRIAEKSKRKSSISLNVSEANQSKDEIINSIYKSQRKSSVSNNDENDANLNESSNKSERKSSHSLNVSNDKNASKKSVENSSRKLSISANNENNEKLDESFKKSIRKSSISELNQKSSTDENNESNILNKLKRNSLSQTELLEKSGNENKSTLVMSQLKDVSNASMSSNVTNNELTKSLNDPEIKSNGINIKNLSVNCLTSTPIQQKPLHKLAMQINTTFKSPTINQSEAIESTPKLNISSKKTSDSDSQDEMCDIKPTKQTDSVLKNNAAASSSSDSSDNRSKTDSRIRSKKFIKKSPAKTHPAHDSSESSYEESDINIKKAPTKNNGNDSKIKEKNDKSPVDSSESGDSDEVSKNEMLDDEASEASDDYQSGDSRDEEEKRYEAENEIVDKGETLDSEENLSDDSDYEKDSFLVSSDAEDSEMLSGTGDDLSMSDNELDISAKSKKKFNDRKIKQQKRASREMYEARHKNDKSANSTAENSKSVQTKMTERHCLESSTSDTEKLKKYNRLRLDSGQDRTDDETIGCENQTINKMTDILSMSKVETDEFIGIKKKKSKRLSESLCEDQTMHENEISKVADESIVLVHKNKKNKRLSESMCQDIITLNQSAAVEKNDPLSAAIKQEPKTSQKFDMSTVAINDDVEEIQVDANASIIKQNESKDPLQVTMTADNDNETSSSDEGEFVLNYDTVLSKLSKQSNIKKTMDTSLDLNKKTNKSKDPLIDQLNLTQTKPSKKNKKDKSLVKSPVKVNTEDAENSSDSIDMKLLFPEDSNDSEIHAKQFKPKDSTDFIPLKRTEAKTNIHENMGKSISLNESTLNVSKKKDKKRKLSQCVPDEEPIKFKEANEQEDTSIQMYIDTTGTHQESDKSPSKSSKKKNKNKSSSESMADTEEIDCTDGIAKSPIETFFTSEKKKNKNKSSDKGFVGDHHSDNKITKRPNSMSEFEETHTVNTGNTIIQDTPANDSIKSEKKKKKKADVSQIIEHVPEPKTSATKKSKKSISKDVSDVSQIIEHVPEPKTSATKKSKKSISEDVSDVSQIIEHVPEPKTSATKKSKKSISEDVSDVSQIIEHVPEPKTSATKKSKKSISEDLSELVHNTETEITPADTLMTNEKKKKKNKKNKNDEVSQILMDIAGEDSDEAPIEISFKSTKKSYITVEEEQTIVGNGEASTNRKRKTRKILPAIPEDTNYISMTNDKKPKNYQHLNDECIAAYDDDTEQGNGDGNGNNAGNSKKSKKNKNLKQQDYIIQEEIVHKPRKRKNRHDDSQQKISKISKQNLYDEVHVPTLPESVLDQLTDKRTREEKTQNKTSKKKVAKAISTAPFVVEEVVKRKNKPSNYLEQSVYLNESPEKDKKFKPKQKNPKVLPFTPTALTSDSGYTSKFNINVLPNDTQFVAQSSNVQNFKESFLGNQRIKKMGTFERCKIQRSRKLSKF